MEDQEIEVKIAPDGTVNIDMICYKGSSCETDMKKIAKALGAVVTSKKKTEFYDDEAKVRIHEQE